MVEMEEDAEAGGRGYVTLRSNAPLVASLYVDQRRRPHASCDTYVLCKDGEIPCHRFVLMANSSFMKRIILDNLKDIGHVEASKQSISLIFDGVKIRHMKIVLTLFYAGRSLCSQQEIFFVNNILVTLGLPQIELAVYEMDSLENVIGYAKPRFYLCPDSDSETSSTETVSEKPSTSSASQKKVCKNSHSSVGDDKNPESTSKDKIKKKTRKRRRRSPDVSTKTEVERKVRPTITRKVKKDSDKKLSKRPKLDRNVKNPRPVMTDAEVKTGITMAIKNFSLKRTKKVESNAAGVYKKALLESVAAEIKNELAVTMPGPSHKSKKTNVKKKPVPKVEQSILTITVESKQPKPKIVPGDPLAVFTEEEADFVARFTARAYAELERSESPTGDCTDKVVADPAPKRPKPPERKRFD